MPTILFEEIVFGPVRSRRLGVSLGVNLSPLHGKFCSFDCLYCECGLNAQHKTGVLPKAEEVRAALEKKMLQLKAEGITPDVVTFSGNGEPTMHPDFEWIIDETLLLRDRYFPSAKVSVLSNATQLDRPGVFFALQKVDNAILKLDSAFDETVRILDRPAAASYTVKDQVEKMKKFNGRLVVQTLFVRGMYEGQAFDNTTEMEIAALIERIREINPESMMIYAIDRETPVSGLEKISLKELKTIARRLKEETGVPVSVAG